MQVDCGESPLHAIQEPVWQPLFHYQQRLPRLPWSCSLQPPITIFLVPGSGTKHFCSHLIVWNSVTWPDSPAGESGKCSLTECPGKNPVTIDADELPVVCTTHCKQHCGGRGESQQPRVSPAKENHQPARPATVSLGVLSWISRQIIKYEDVRISQHPHGRIPSSRP